MTFHNCFSWDQDGQATLPNVDHSLNVGGVLPLSDPSKGLGTEAVGLECLQLWGHKTFIEGVWAAVTGATETSCYTTGECQLCLQAWGVGLSYRLPKAVPKVFGLIQIQPRSGPKESSMRP